MNVFWSQEDGGFIAVVPDLPGCSAFGESEEQALREAQNAIKAWLQANANAGRIAPEPSVAEVWRV